MSAYVQGFGGYQKVGPIWGLVDLREDRRHLEVDLRHQHPGAVCSFAHVMFPVIPGAVQCAALHRRPGTHYLETGASSEADAVP